MDSETQNGSVRQNNPPVSTLLERAKVSTKLNPPTALLSLIGGDADLLWNSATKEEEEKELKKFASLYGGKYPKTVECLEKEKKELFTFHAFPEQHWRHIRSTNLIESTVAAVRPRTHKTRGCLSRTTALAMV
ncbi:MAG: transposase, partial [Myxococcota bacterium]